MSKILQFFDQTNTITVSYTKKNYPSKGYSQSFINIQVSSTQSGHPFLDVDLNDDCSLFQFQNLQEFYNYLRKNKEKELARVINGCQVVFTIEGEAGVEYQIISLSSVKVVSQKEHEQMQKEVALSNQIFRTKMVQKMQKMVKNHFKNVSRNEKKLEDKKLKSIGAGEVVFSLSSEQYNVQHSIKEQSPIYSFPVYLEDIYEREFKIKVNRLNFDRLVVGVEYMVADLQIEPHHQATQFKRMCQFCKAFESSLRIQEGQSIGVSLEDGQLLIRNILTNDARVFTQSIGHNQQDWNYRIFVSLQEQ